MQIQQIAGAWRFAYGAGATCVRRAGLRICTCIPRPNCCSQRPKRGIGLQSVAQAGFIKGDLPESQALPQFPRSIITTRLEGIATFPVTWTGKACDSVESISTGLKPASAPEKTFSRAVITD